MLQNAFRRALLVGMAVVGVLGVATAAEPVATGLGQAWPNTTDVSLSLHYHVYVFVRDGIRYIQVNDESGMVRGAIATADQTVLVLPVGVDAARVKTMRLTGAHAALPTESRTTETIYRDQAMTISATPQTNGTVQITALATCTDPGECSNGGP